MLAWRQGLSGQQRTLFSAGTPSVSWSMWRASGTYSMVVWWVGIVEWWKEWVQWRCGCHWFHAVSSYSQVEHCSLMGPSNGQPAKFVCGHASINGIFILIQPKLWSVNNKVKQTPQDSIGQRHCSGCKESIKSPERVPLFRHCLTCYCCFLSSSHLEANFEEKPVVMMSSIKKGNRVILPSFGSKFWEEACCDDVSNQKRQWDDPTIIWKQILRRSLLWWC